MHHHQLCNQTVSEHRQLGYCSLDQRAVLCWNGLCIWLTGVIKVIFIKYVNTNLKYASNILFFNFKTVHNNEFEIKFINNMSSLLLKTF